MKQTAPKVQPFAIGDEEEDDRRRRTIGGKQQARVYMLFIRHNLNIFPENLTLLPPD